MRFYGLVLRGLHVSARQYHTYGIVMKNGTTLDEIVNASEPLTARPNGITRVIHTGPKGDSIR
jgi:hypothetical protein